MNISLIIPSYNNLRHLKNAYESVRRHYPVRMDADIQVELILIDDGSDDGTFEWLQTLQDDNLIYSKEPNRIGHTILYDKGIDIATNDIVGILHADMYIGPNYIENMVKHLSRGKVVCSTRIEPPLHPPGDEKIIADFGMDFDSLNIEGFEKIVADFQQRPAMKDITTRGMFAPWLLYKEDFQAIGGHDWNFAPFPYEDSDIFQRWILAGYEMVQSRDSFVYHLTCRGHRWNKEIGKNDEEFRFYETKAHNYYVKKWGSWISNDRYGHPILKPIYRRSLKVNNDTGKLHHLNKWVNYGNDIEITVDELTFTQDDMNNWVNLNQIIQQSGEVGEFKVGNIKVKINKIEDISEELIKVENSTEVLEEQ